MEFLVFRLYGPLASWGDTAVGGTRPSHLMPTRSAILGLLAAALGIARSEQSRLDQLSEALHVSAKAESAGVLIRDYHTAQVPSAERKTIWNHRKAETENTKSSLNTILSTRDYRADADWVIAISRKPDSDFDLAGLAEALRYPIYPLYLGRKACPPAAPLQPQIVNVDDLASALATSFESPCYNVEATRNIRQPMLVYQWEVDDSGFESAETSEQWDEPGIRSRWQFGKRTVFNKRVTRSG